MSDAEPPELNPTGYEWLGRFMEAQANVQANALFLAFSIGQTGVAIAVAKTDDERQRASAMIEALEQDRKDLRQAARQLDDVLRDMVANARRNAP